MESIEEVARKLKKDMGRWEEEIFHWACQLARGMAEALLAEIDEELMKKRGKEVKVVGLRERGMTTLFGDIRVRRRLYQDSEGNYRYLLDESIGLRKGSRVSPKVEELATYLCSYLPFEKSERVLRVVLPEGISHNTIHRLVGKVVDPYLDEEEKEIADVFEQGVIPSSEGRVVSPLMVEADGVSIALQREEERRTEVKLGIVYEGWEKVASDRYKLKGKAAYAGIMDGDRFWEGLSLSLAKKYDLARIEKVIVGGDGASWAREGAQVLGGLYQLSRFHLRRALLRGLKGDVKLADQVYRACVTGKIGIADALLGEVQGQASGEDSQDIARLRGYLIDNACGLADYRLGLVGDGLRGIGAIEGNVDKLIAIRMKKRGMSWTKRGGNRMVRLMNLREGGQLHTWINRRPEKSKAVLTSEEGIKQHPRSKDSGWLEAGLPALYGPHASRPWARVLRAIAHGGA